MVLKAGTPQWFRTKITVYNVHVLYVCLSNQWMAPLSFRMCYRKTDLLFCRVSSACRGGDSGVPSQLSSVDIASALDAIIKSLDQASDVSPDATMEEGKL